MAAVPRRSGAPLAEAPSDQIAKRPRIRLGKPPVAGRARGFLGRGPALA
jgi:hypothetical protein